jgi:hypothetical protein
MDNYKYFSNLCESIVSEASTTMAKFNGPGAQEILKQLHSKEALGHDVQPEPVVRPKWTDLKDKPETWLLISVCFFSGHNRDGLASNRLHKFP